MSTLIVLLPVPAVAAAVEAGVSTGCRDAVQTSQSSRSGRGRVRVGESICEAVGETAAQGWVLYKDIVEA